MIISAALIEGVAFFALILLGFIIAQLTSRVDRCGLPGRDIPAASDSVVVPGSITLSPSDREVEHHAPANDPGPRAPGPLLAFSTRPGSWPRNRPRNRAMVPVLTKEGDDALQSRRPFHEAAAPRNPNILEARHYEGSSALATLDPRRLSRPDAGVLGKFAWKPLMKALEEREAHLEHVLLDSEKARNEAEALAAQHRKELATGRRPGPGLDRGGPQGSPGRRQLDHPEGPGRGRDVAKFGPSARSPAPRIRP